MAEGRSFNLDELLGEEHVRHYLRFIKGSGDTFEINPSQITFTGSTATVWGNSSSASQQAAPEAASRMGSGPEDCSAVNEIAVRPEWCWDICGYYRRLGAWYFGAFWRATRRQLTDSYLANGGQASQAMSYALKMLFTPKIRAMYDNAPLGGLFLLDRDLQELIRRNAIKQAARERQMGMGTQSEDVLQRWGLATEPPPAEGEAAAQEEIRELPEPQEPEPGEVLGGHLSGWERQWTWYYMAGAPLDPSPLPQWQDLLRQAFRQQGAPRTRFAVGLYPGSSFRIHHQMSAGARIILLGTEPPTLALATRAASEFMALHRNGVQHGNFRYRS